LKAACSRRSFVISSSWAGRGAAVAAGVADPAVEVGRYATDLTWACAGVELIGVRAGGGLKVELPAR
jgi:hypothetical protein